ncbi:MAG: transcriptional regulator [Pseudomonadota bacterium]
MTAPTITAQQFRMAKAALKLTNSELSSKTGLHRNTLVQAEKGRASVSTMSFLRAYFEQGDLEFIDENGGGAGVRSKKP